MVLFIGYFYLLLRKHIDIGSRRALIDLILFMLTTGVWIVGDSKLLLIISRNVAANTIITYNALILFPIFLVMFVSEMVEHRLPFLDVLPALFLLDDLVMMLGYLTHSFSPYQCLDSVHILMGISMLLGVGGSVWDVKKNKNAEMIKLLAGFTCFGLFGVLSIVQYRVSRVSNYPMYCCIGLLIFMLFIIWAASGKLYRIMDQNASAQAYQKLAYLDVMTGMGNRAAFVKAQSELSAEISVGLAIMDINNLKYTNDHYGHQAGDEMICSAAACIDRAFGANGRVYRIGGDEFAVIVKNATEELMENMLGALEQALLETQQAQDRPWKLQIAYGYALHVGGAAQDNFETLFKQADDRMYERKRRMKAADKI
jgi:diguanylate cyclase (GGDEF)-like protein